jgi:hypothetical protein
MKKGDLVMYDANLAVTAIIIDIKQLCGSIFMLDLLQSTGRDHFIIQKGLNPLYLTKDFTVCEEDRETQMIALMNRQI